MAWFLCKDGLPLYNVEKEGFQKLIQTMDNQYELPNRTRFSRHVIPELYASTKQKVVMKLADVNFLPYQKPWLTRQILLAQRLDTVVITNTGIPYSLMSE